ncbi:hypothetical protein E2320_013592 [Naja naja]|nr:hypothetical protein E2320_013592 [Naja naja]
MAGVAGPGVELGSVLVQEARAEAPAALQVQLAGLQAKEHQLASKEATNAQDAQPTLHIGSSAEVQEDLQHLKKQLRDFSHDWETADAESLESVVEKTENRLREHAEKYLNAVNRSVLTIFPADDVERSSRQISRW